MTIASLPRKGLCLMLILGAGAVHAAGTVTRFPTTPAGASEVDVALAGIVALNPGRDPVFTNAGMTSISAASVDADAGIIRGYAALQAPTGGTALVNEQLVAAAQGLLSSDIQVLSSLSGPQTITAELSFDASFAALAGDPTFYLIGGLTAIRANVGATSINASHYMSQLHYRGYASDVYTDTISRLDMIETDLSTGASTSTTAGYAGATQQALSADPATLAGVVSLSFDVMPGDIFTFTASVSGLAGPQLIGVDVTDPYALDFGVDSVSFAASSGVLDFSNTASLTLYVPQGVTLVGDDFVSAVTVTSAVPEPTAALMMMLGLATLGWFGRSRR